MKLMSANKKLYENLKAKFKIFTKLCSKRITLANTSHQ